MEIRNIDNIEFRAIEAKDVEVVANFIETNWGSPAIVSKGKFHNVKNLAGFMIAKDNDILGLVTYHVKDGECEIVSLDSVIENKGIGSKLVDHIVDLAKEERWSRVWLITTNDNTRAIRFYQKKGFNMKALYLNAIDYSRKIKPQIPAIGYDGIPIRHELEFELILNY